MTSSAATVDEYLAGLPADRRDQVEALLEVIRPHMPQGLSEEMGFGMITWVVPLSVLPKTYNGKPLMYAALASQKNYISLYLMTLYSGAAGPALGEEGFREQWQGAKRLNMGKSCVRFTEVADIDLPLICRVLDSVGMAEFVAAYEESRRK